MKKYSLIIPTLNEAETLEDFLLPLQKLRGQCEIIISDAGSEDNIQEIAAPFVDLFITTAQGRAKQMNAGVNYATTERLIFLHADTYLPESALVMIQQGLEQGELWGRFDIQLIGSHYLLKIIAQMMNWRSRLTGIATGDQVIFMTNPVFQQVGGFPDIALMEDIAMSKQLKKLAAPYCIKARVKSSARRWESFGVWKTVLLMWSLRLRYFFGESPDILLSLYRRGVFLKNQAET